jgi:hypothetical protein
VFGLLGLAASLADVTIEAAQVIAELLELAKQVRAAAQRGETLGLTEDELAFYDALGVNDSAVQVLGDATLRAIARDLVETVHRSVTIDWTVKESVRANLRRAVRRVLRKHGYPRTSKKPPPRPSSNKTKPSPKLGRRRPDPKGL